MDKGLSCYCVCVSKKGQTSTPDKPIQHLYPLYVNASPANATVSTTDESPPELHVANPPRSRKSTAAQARDCILAQALLGYKE